MYKDVHEHDTRHGDGPDASRPALRLIHAPQEPAQPPDVATSVARTHRPGAPDGWDSAIHEARRADRRLDTIRSGFSADYRGWEPGTLVDVAAINDRAAIAMARRFLRVAKRARVEPSHQAYRIGSRIVRTAPRPLVRRVTVWEIASEYSWVLLTPSGRLALQAHPDEFAKIVTDDGGSPVVIAGINAPPPYGVTAAEVSEFVLRACRTHDLDW